MTPVEYLHHWIYNDLSKPQKTLNGLASCPFAKPALQDNKLDFVYVTQQTFPDTVNLSDLDAVVLVFTDLITPEKLIDLANQFNKNHPDLVALEDHPNEPEILEDVVFNNGEYPILIIQTRHKLEKYRQSLRKKGYYDSWPKDMLDNLLSI